ncbi:BatD family protein [Luteibaculum oceani]|uniref:BatD family protein n=1 Tax=Luteibaculum oceani TaxID=1294296 RepID=UPI0014771CC1|nr:BatD family protein [Luteibaculum oceani]
MLGQLGFGQDFRASVSQNPVSVGSRFTLSFTLENTSGEITPPPISDFRIIFGPSQSSNFSFINGKSSRTTTISYVMLAEEEGTFTIPAATANTKDGVLKTDPIKLEVVKGNNNTAQSSSSKPQSSSQTPSVKGNGNVIIQIAPSKTTAHIGEPITVSYILYSRYSQLELGETDYPALSGFWVENINLGSVQWDDNLATINGNKYRRAVIKKQLLYPQRSGELEIPSFTQNVVVNRSFFNPGSRVSANSNAVKIRVKPYPSSAPGNFSNISGKFRIVSGISNQKVDVNEAVTYTLKISGQGNLKLLNPPEINFPSDFEVYEPKTNDNIRVNADGISGYREWEYIIIPRYPGDYKIPKVSFSYFDLNSKNYKTISTSEIDLLVEGSAISNTNGTVVNPKTDVALLNEDIRFIDIHWDSNFVKQKFGATRGLFWILSTAIILIFLLIALKVKKDQSLKQNQKEYKRKKASKLADKKLAKAKKHLSQKDQAGFYIEIISAIHGYIQDKFGFSKTDLSRNTLKEKLLAKGAAEEEINRLQELIDDCDMARYAPSANVNMESTYERAKATLQWLEKLQA